eukprot:342303-Pelagomonas_calceolata.AAC.1
MNEVGKMAHKLCGLCSNQQTLKATFWEPKQHHPIIKCVPAVSELPRPRQWGHLTQQESTNDALEFCCPASFMSQRLKYSEYEMSVEEAEI